MVPVDIAAIICHAGDVTSLFFAKIFRRTYDMALLKSPAEAIKDPATFKAGWVVLLLLLVGFFVTGTARHSGERHCSCGRADIICRR